MTASPAYYRELLAGKFRGRKVVFAYGHARMMSAEVGLARELGARDVFVLCEGEGTGDGVVDFQHWIREDDGRVVSLLDYLRGFEAIVRDLPPEARAALDAFDPDRQALVLRPLWGSLLEVAGRPVYNARPPSWVALEDKVIIDALWDRFGVPRAPCHIVAAEREALERAHRELDRGAGTVWAGDAREGWHGGSEMTHWVIDRDHGDRAAAILAAHCDRVRVMPFLEGIPCSIHGIVAGDQVAALRPVEMVTLRDPAAARLRYFGTSTLWDPPAADREAMRALARHVAVALREELGFRGTFTIDGVMTADGFRPTELNSRYGAGMYRLGASLPELPLWFLDCAMVAGEPWDFRLAELEALVVGSADASRAPVINAWDPHPRDTNETTEVTRGPHGLCRAARGDAVYATVASGPSRLGSFHKITVSPTALTVGDSVGPAALELLAFCDRELGTHFGPLASARVVR